jgi:hypothetical protein
MKKQSLAVLAVAGALGVVRAVAATEPEPVKFTGGSPAAFQTLLDQAPTGAANIVAQVPPQATGSNTAATVTNASGLLLAQNSNRQYLLIQNKDTTGSIYINFGATATTANGVQIEPLGSFELNNNMLTAAIYAIGDIASNANVVIVSA